ncbi:MAG: hypothetical protein GC192_17260 [Bacteroidetes bacterium]|nr:hypothetical protein [Bacteroidota bacterium]
MQNEPLDYEEDKQSNDFFYKPSLVLRFKSIFIDAMVIIFLMVIASWALNGLSIESGAIRGIVLVSIFLYEPIAMAFGRTLGQHIVGLQVTRKAEVLANTTQYRPIPLVASLVRYLLKGLLGWASLLTIHSDKYGQAIHDKLTGSVVCFKD